jgi:hypothetical protein
MAAIGTWAEPLTDEQVVQDLRDWNAAPWETPLRHLNEAK